MTINLVYCQRTPPCTASFSYQGPSAFGAYLFVGRAGGGSSPYTYSWDFGDGTTGTGQTATHSYNASGSYRVCLTITDANGCTATDCQTVRVGNPNPTCSASFTYRNTGNLGVQFTDQSSPSSSPNSASLGVGLW